MTDFNRNDPRGPQPMAAPTGGSWWIDSARERFTAEAAKRFVGTAFPSHKRPRPVYESTEDATMKRAPLPQSYFASTDDSED